MRYYKSRGNVSNILLLVAILGVVIILMYNIKKREFKLPTFSPKLTQFAEAAKEINGIYYNKPFRFSISAPDSNWKFIYSPEIDSSVLVRSSENNPQFIVKISRHEKNDTLAIVNVGLFQLEEMISPKNLAARNLRQIKNRYKTKEKAVSVISDVVVAGTGYMVGAFYMVELPQKSTHPYPVWVTMFFIRKDLAFKIFCRLKRDKYEFLKTDIEQILKNFKFI